MEKHTPGPWSVSECGTTVWAEAPLRRIADVRHVRDADAALIAAAPELLAVLKQAGEVIHNHIDVREPVCVPGISRLIRAAIAKAEGR